MDEDSGLYMSGTSLLVVGTRPQQAVLTKPVVVGVSSQYVQQCGRPT
jgi:hypothetical protein